MPTLLRRRDHGSPTSGSPTRRKRSSRRFQLENLEDRTLLSFTVISQPTTAYVATTTNMSGSIPADGTSITSLSDGTETVNFSSTVTAQTVPVGWSTWNSPPSNRKRHATGADRYRCDFADADPLEACCSFLVSKPSRSSLSATTMTATFMAGTQTCRLDPLELQRISECSPFCRRDEPSLHQRGLDRTRGRRRLCHRPGALRS